MMLRRPTTIDEVQARLGRFTTAAARAAVDDIVVRPDDVFIATYPKSGTTWVQQVVHQLRSRGHTDFAEIMEVVPFLEVAFDAGIDPRSEQRWSPRVFKTHLPRSDVPKGACYITVFRDPRTVVTSFYRFFEGWWFEPGAVSLDEFAHGLYLGGTTSGRHWDHLVDWWPRVGDTDVLALSYEDMSAVPDDVPVVVADFLGITLDDETMATVVRHSSREWMTQHAAKFDEHLLRERRDADWGLPPDGESAKITTGGKPALSPDLEAALEDRWTEIVERALGFASYTDLRAALPNPLGVRRDRTSRSTAPP